MLKPAVLLCACLLATACASRLPPAEIKPTLQRVKPLEAMGPSQQEAVQAACKFAPGVWNVGLAEQAAFIRNCIEILGPAYRESELLRAELVKWIEAE